MYAVGMGTRCVKHNCEGTDTQIVRNVGKLPSCFPHDSPLAEVSFPQVE